MKKIILDTNFLMIPGRFKIDIFSEIDRMADFNYKFFIIDKTIDELEKIINNKESKLKDREYAKIGLGLVRAKNIESIKSNDESVDEAIIRVSDRDTIVASSDRELKRELRKKGVKIINLRKKQYLVLE